MFSSNELCQEAKAKAKDVKALESSIMMEVSADIRRAIRYAEQNFMPEERKVLLKALDGLNLTNVIPAASTRTASVDIQKKYSAKVRFVFKEKNEEYNSFVHKYLNDTGVLLEGDKAKNIYIYGFEPDDVGRVMTKIKLATGVDAAQIKG